MTLAALAGCATAAASPRTVSVWTRAANLYEGRAIVRAAESFNRAQHLYRVELLATDVRNRDEHIHAVAATGSLPCVLEIDGPFVAAFAWPGYLKPLDEFVTPTLRRDLLPSIVAQGSYDGHLYALGQFDSGLGLWANRRYLAAAGVRLPTVARPWTLDEFEQALARLARVPGVDYPLNLALYTGASEFYAYAFLPILAGFGGDFIDRGSNGRAEGVLDGPASVAAMTHLQSWFRKGWTRAVFDHNDDFQKGRNALLWTGHWRYLDLHRALGDDLVLLPLPDFGHGLKTGIGSWSWAISSTCTEPAGAWAFLAHLMSVPEILRMTEANGAVPARRSALARSPLYGRRAPLEVYAQQIATGAGLPRPATPGYGVITKAFAQALLRIVGGADVRSELAGAARTIDEDIADHGGYAHR